MIEYRPVEPIVAKGKTDPVQAWVAVAPLVEAGERVFSEAPLVGRGEELANLRSLWDMVSSEHRCSLVTVFGPAGIGKSRLAHELAHRATSSGGLAIRGRSAGYGDAGPYSAFAQHVAQIAGIRQRRPDGGGREAASKAAALAVADDPDEVADAVAILAGLPGRRRPRDREGLYFSARLFVEAVARERPTLLVFEDIHFADPSLLDLVEFLASRVQDVPLFLVATRGPSCSSPGRRGVVALLASSAFSLGPLDDEDAVDLTGQALRTTRPGRR